MQRNDATRRSHQNGGEESRNANPCGESGEGEPGGADRTESEPKGSTRWTKRTWRTSSQPFVRSVVTANIMKGRVALHPQLDKSDCAL